MSIDVKQIYDHCNHPYVVIDTSWLMVSGCVTYLPTCFKPTPIQSQQQSFLLWSYMFFVFRNALTIIPGSSPSSGVVFFKQLVRVVKVNGHKLQCISQPISNSSNRIEYTISKKTGSIDLQMTPPKDFQSSWLYRSK